ACGRSGAFYLADLGRPNGGGGPGNTVTGCTVSADRSTDGGKTYSFSGHAFICPWVGTRPFCTPDQEHVAAFRGTRERQGPVPTGGRRDQVYVVWRQMTDAPSPGQPPAANCAATIFFRSLHALAITERRGLIFSS